VKEWRKMLGTNNFFYRLIQKRQRRFWEKFFSIPQSLIRVCMFILQNGNRVEKQSLVDELVKIGCIKNSNSCKVILYRGIEKNILKDVNGYISVADPIRFVVKEVRGNVLDNWKALVLLTLVLTIAFAPINTVITLFFGVVSLVIVIAWFLEDWRSTQKF